MPPSTNKPQPAFVLMCRSVISTGLLDAIARNYAITSPLAISLVAATPLKNLAFRCARAEERNSSTRAANCTGARSRRTRTLADSAQASHLQLATAEENALAKLCSSHARSSWAAALAGTPLWSSTRNACVAGAKTARACPSSGARISWAEECLHKRNERSCSAGWLRGSRTCSLA